MSADYKVQRLYDEYIHDIVSSAENWKNFLRITGRIYRYEFDNILMVYAQRPNATLVGDYDSWKKVGRYVKRGSRGIAIFPSKILKPHMRYIFDISDTGGKNVKLTWDLNGDNLKSLVDELTEEGKIEPYLNDDRKNLENLLKNYTKENIRSIMKEKSEAGISELNRITGGVINGGDNETQGLTVEEMLYESVLYAVGTRCGFDMSAEEQDMSFIINISDEDDIYRFGSLVCDVSCSVLKEFNYRVRRIEKERSVTNERKENNLSRGSRRNAVSESGIATGAGNKHDTDRKVRNDGSRVSEGKREEQIQHTVSSGKTGREDEGSGHGGKQPDGHTDDGLLKETQTSESYFNNGNVETKESGKDDGRGSGSKSDSVQISLENESENSDGQINEELNKELDEINSFGVSREAGFEQASFLFDDNTKEITVADSKKPLPNQRKKYTYMEPKKERVVPHDYIVSVLLRGTGFVGGKERVYKIYQTVDSPSERAKLIKKEFGLGGAGWPIDGYGLHGYDTFKPQGMRFQWRDAEGEKEGYVSWNTVEEELRVLINKGEYYQEIIEEEIIGEYDIPDEVFEMGKKPISDMERDIEKKDFHYNLWRIETGGSKTRYQWNVEAIKTLKQIEKEERNATDDEQKILSQYAGWGGIPEVFDEKNDLWRREYKELKELLTRQNMKMQEQVLIMLFTLLLTLPCALIRHLQTLE